MKDNEKPEKKELIIDLDNELTEAITDYEKLKENPTTEEEAAYVLGISKEEYRKKVEEIAEALGLTVEEYQKRQRETSKKLYQKQQEFIKTGNPVSVFIDMDGNIVG